MYLLLLFRVLIFMRDLCELVELVDNTSTNIVIFSVMEKISRQL